MTTTHEFPLQVCNVLHRQLLSQENTATQARIMAVVGLTVKAAAENLAARKIAKLKEIFPANQSLTQARGNLSVVVIVRV